jgi:hypothetical protein
MAVRDIPATRTIVCDGCGKTAEGSLPGDWAVLHVKQNALDWHGTACADASVRRELCAPCKSAVIEAMNAAIRALRTEGKQ